MSIDLPLIELYLPSSSVLMRYNGGDGYQILPLLLLLILGVE